MRRARKRLPATRVGLALLIGASLAANDRVAAQEIPPRAGRPTGAEWEPVQSIGQPSRWRGLFGLAYGIDGPDVGGEAGAGASLAVFRDLLPPHYGFAALGVEGYFGQRGEGSDGGVRLLFQAQTLFVHGGVDWSLNHDRGDALIGVSFPVRRGGWPVRGGMLRLDWLPERGHSLVLGATAPLGQPRAGRTRPRQVDFVLPVPSRKVPGAAPPTGPAAAALDTLRESTRWLTALHNFFWLAEPTALSHESAVAESREALIEFRQQLAARETLFPERNTYDREVEHYHGTLDRAFGLAAGAAEADADRIGRYYAEQARRLALEEVLLPYNRTIGQYKQPDVLDGLTARARARFTAWVELDAPGGESGRHAVLGVMDAWLADFERLRSQIARSAPDSRMHWLPLALVLRPEAHRTQAQIDDLVALAFGRGFEPGNATLFVNAPQFQLELLRTIHDAESYHVLWIFDYPAYNPAGQPDATAFFHSTAGYLRALIGAVRAYDERERLPVYMILLDAHLYELRNARRWMDLLERPLDHRVRLPARYRAMAMTIAALQDSLRTAVAESRRLQAEEASFGGQWISRLVKVHVNITNPSDFSFRSRRMLPLPLGADNMMRDHRKIVIRDVTDARPTEGEVILAGTGVGDGYTSPTWDDRALLLQGPGALEALYALRSILERHGLAGERLPLPLRPEAPARDFATQIASAEDAGATARVMQVHNRTGFAAKDATYVQMLLYDLAPPGTVIYVPDSLWSSYHWMAQLVSAALRGCHVYVVAPARGNAPSDGFPQLSRAQELLTRLVLVREEFSEVIAAAGGDLRVGLFTREAPLDDIPALIAELLATYDATPFLREIFPFPEEMLDALRAFPKWPHTRHPGITLPEPVERRPQLHRKTQLIASRELIEALAGDSVLANLVHELLAQPSELIVHQPESGPLIHQRRMEPASRLPRRVESLLESGSVSEPVLYFMSGSMNKNVRSMALDGEAMAVVAGPWALQAYLDFAVLSGTVTWIDRLEELEARFPPFPRIKRWIGRWLHHVL